MTNIIEKLENVAQYGGAPLPHRLTMEVIQEAITKIRLLEQALRTIVSLTEEDGVDFCQEPQIRRNALSGLAGEYSPATTMPVYAGIDIVNPTKGAASPLIWQSWRYGFNGEYFGFMDEGPFVAVEAIVPGYLAALDKIEMIEAECERHKETIVDYEEVCDLSLADEVIKTRKQNIVLREALRECYNVMACNDPGSAHLALDALRAAGAFEK